MDVNEKIENRLDELLIMGEVLLETRKSPPSNIIGGDDRINSQLAHQWVTSVQNLLVRVFGSDSEHYKNFSKQVEKHLTFSPIFCAQGILKAAKEDYVSEQLFAVRQLIEAELFDDFLEQAEYLLASGYYQPAAVVAGCVLEDGLRKLCKNNKIEIPENPKLDTLNSNLSKDGVYSKLIQKKITALADLRNKAAHGKWNEFAKEDVEEMIQTIRRIMEEFFS
ncbi:MAG: HEPN domain-containing protein [Anaerolineaceae bacterium]|nr:MAG: HEPN domain-containing protein [Anaerolineaceae bacterium]